MTIKYQIMTGALLALLMLLLHGSPALGYNERTPGGFSYEPSVTYYPFQLRYPFVIAQPIDVLPQGYSTIFVGTETFYYQDGVFYQKDKLEQKYLIVRPPIGAVVSAIPQGYQLIRINNESYYAYLGIYYRRVLEGYQVIPPLAPAYVWLRSGEVSTYPQSYSD